MLKYIKSCVLNQFNYINEGEKDNERLVGGRGVGQRSQLEKLERGLFIYSIGDLSMLSNRYLYFNVYSVSSPSVL